MRLRIRDHLPVVNADLTYRGQALRLERVLVDSGSATTIVRAKEVQAIGLTPEPSDVLRRIQGVGGGTESVFTRQVDRLSVGDLCVTNFEVEVGVMNYRVDIEGIVGVDFLRQVRAIIDLARLEIRCADA